MHGARPAQPAGRRAGLWRPAHLRQKHVVTTFASMAPPPAMQLPPDEAPVRELLEEQLRGKVAAVARDNVVGVDGLSVDVPLGVRVRLGDGVRGFLLGRLDGLSCVFVTEGKADSVAVGAAAEVEPAFAIVPPSDSLLGRTVEVSTLVSYTDKGPGSWCVCCSHACDVLSPPERAPEHSLL